MKTAKLPLYYIGMLLMALPFFFTSCSSDDDGFTPSAGGSDTAGQITGSDGEKLYITSVGDNTFSYNSEGKITKCRAYGSDDYISPTIHSRFLIPIHMAIIQMWQSITILH